MTQSDKAHPVRDSDLVAYIDGQLATEERVALEDRIAADPGLKERLRVLESGDRPYREAFDAMLGLAPTDRLTVMLEDELNRHETADHAALRKGIPVWAALAASLIVFVAGGVAGYALRSPGGLPSFLGVSEQEEEVSNAWRQIIASNLALYTPEGLAEIGPEAAPSDARLKSIGAKLGVDLSKARLDLSGLELKEARLLEFGGVPFAQVIYLDPRHGPVAFCILAGQQNAEAAETEVRSGMNLVYWVAAGLGFMLVGRAPMPELEALTTTLTKEFSKSPA